jgi:5-methylcytosine-specific restriction endonuclease McrA
MARVSVKSKAPEVTCKAPGCAKPVRARISSSGPSPESCAEHSIWGRGKPRPARSCATCDADLAGRRMNTIYCSRDCREIAYGVQSNYPDKICALMECDVEFRPHYKNQRYCSERHGKIGYNRAARADGRDVAPWTDRRRDTYHRRKARKKGASTGRPVLLAEIAVRDGWVCGICAEIVDPAQQWPAAGSPSVDHVVPLSKGGAHDPSNVQLAHLSCNSSKGDRLEESA